MKGKFDEIINSETPVLVDFYANWCGPCKAMGPILDEVKKELGDNIRIIKINTDENPEISMKYSIRSIPTLILFQNGEGKFRESGVRSKEAIINLIEKSV